LPTSPSPTSGDEGHVVQFYADDQFLLDALCRFVGGAIAVGDAAVVIATQAHQTGLAKRLEARGIDTSKAIHEGRYVLLDASETLPKLMIDGMPDESRFADMIGGVLSRARSAGEGNNAGVMVFGELVALLWAEGKPQAAIRLEQFWNNLALQQSFSLLCAYPITGFNHEKHTELFLKICEQHSDVVPSESYVSLGSEQERLRSITYLQHKAQVLENQLALRQSETRFRLLVEAVQDYAIFMLDPDGRVSNWNAGAERIKGYKAAEIIGKHFSCFYPEEDLRSGKPQWELEVATKTGRFEDEGWRLRKDGSKFWANVIITAVRDETGKLIGFAKITRDITEKMLAQRELQQASKVLEKEIAERKEAGRKLHESEKSLRQLSLHLLRTQDEERRRIGRDLHDSLGQYLTVLKMKLDSLAGSIASTEKDSHQQQLAQCIQLTEDSIKEVRTISYLLYPPLLEEMGLKSAIPWYLDGFAARSGIKTTFEVHADFARLPRDVELALFRVLQESLTNVHRHSGSRMAHVRLLAREDMVILEVQDEGTGIPPVVLEEAGEDWLGALGVGLRGMNERMKQLGGRLELCSTERGTTVSAMVPARARAVPGAA
jgi:PAS domain S-box-containing protein